MPEQSRRAFCGSIAGYTAALAFFPFANFFTSCNSQPKKRISHPTVQINGINVITNTRYIGNAFAFPAQMVFVSFVPQVSGLSAYAQSISFLGIIAQNTSTAGYNLVKPRDIAFVGLFRQKNGTFRYGYEINGVRHYASGHVPGSDYRYNINFRLNEEGVVQDPDYPHQRRFGYDFQISSGWDASTRLQGLQSSPVFADQLFVGVMDEGNAVHLPDNKHLQLYMEASGNEQTPSAIYKNDDETSQVSSNYSDSDYRIILTLTGSS